MPHLVGAYASAPSDPDANIDFVRGLAQMGAIRGLELPFNGDLATDDPAYLAAAAPHWEYVVTAFPGTMLNNLADPTFGLASTDEAGRAAALEFTDKLRQSACRLNESLGRAAVLAVELHSAPARTADAQAFATSMAEVASWDWQGAEITVEHCDAFVPGQDPQKGYLTLSDEIATVAQLRDAGHRAGITVNWARSVIEGRDPALAAEHIRLAHEHQVLSGLMFSGVASVDTDFVPAWVDGHLPPSAVSDPAFESDLDTLDSASLLTPGAIAESLSAAGTGLSFTGLKTSMRPVDASVEFRLRNIEQSLSLLDR